MAGDATTTSPGEDDWAMAAARELCERYVVKYADVPLLMAPQPWEYELADVIRRHAPKGSDQLAATSAALGLPDGADVAEGVRAYGERVREACVRFVEGGSFLHDDAPAARMARECAAAMRRMPLPPPPPPPVEVGADDDGEVKP